MKRTIEINYKEIDFEIHYDHEPAEPAEVGIEAQYPGSPESIDINNIFCKGVDLLEIFSIEQTQELEYLIWKEQD